MKLYLSAVLYTAIALGAIPATAGSVDLATLREGTLKKLVLHEYPKPVSDVAFTDPDGGEHRLSDWAGKYVLLNFWATWCAPCRKEMPGLEQLQNEFGGDRFEVVPIATGRNFVPGIKRFFVEIGVEDLPIFLDPKQQLARDMAVLGLPISIILDPQGQEIARLRGDAEWDGESARAIIAALTAVE